MSGTNKNLGRYKEQVSELMSKTLFDIPGLADIRSQYTPEQKLTAVMAYALTGSAQKASDITDFSPSTIRKWKEKAPWWEQALSECKKIAFEALDFRFAKLIEKSLEELEDRLENGDVTVLANGKTKITKIKARDLTAIMATIFDKRQLVRGDVTSRTETVNPEARLKKIQQAAEAFGKEQMKRMQEAKDV